tara:strand:- start:121 stop:426 length:306 start_codon:yes stop_codon:yes gene_type:complete
MNEPSYGALLIFQQSTILFRLASGKPTTSVIRMVSSRVQKLMGKHPSVKPGKQSKKHTMSRQEVKMIIISAIITWCLNNIESINANYYSCPPYCGAVHEHN